MSVRTLTTCLALASGALAQSIEDWGTSGGNGPRGGIGDANNPVLAPVAFITDTLISIPGTNATRHLARAVPPVRVPAESSPCDTRKVVVDSSSKGARQEMLGFGFSLTDSSVSVFNTLENDVFDRIMQELFGPEGNNMGLMRHTIGSSDLSRSQYSYDTNGPSFNLGEPNPGLTHFNLGLDGIAMAKMLAKMGEYKSDITVFGAPWSYPGWMKNNHLFIAPNELNGYNFLNNSFNPRYYQSAREYFVKYIDAFKQYGVNVNGLSLQNEPLNYQGGYPCMYLDAVDAAGILSSGLSEDLAARDVKLIAYDHNTDQPVYPYRVSQSAHVDGVGWHCYQSPSANYSVLDDFSVMVPGKVQLMTECTSYKPMPGDYSSWIAQHFIGPVRHGASGGTFWVLATNPYYGPHSPYGGCAGCQGAVFVNSSTTYTKTHDYYMMGQFSRFVRRGSINHFVKEGYEGDQSSPYQFYIMSVQNPDKSWAVIFMNNLQNDQKVALSFTDQRAESWEGTIPKSSVVTWLIPSQERLRQNGTHGGSAPLHPMGNSTGPYPYGLFLRGASGTAPVCTPTTSSNTIASSSPSSTQGLLPVPNTNRPASTNAPVYSLVAQPLQSSTSAT